MAERLFIFLDDFVNITHIPSLVLDDKGNTLCALQNRTYDTLQALQQNKRVIAIIPTKTTFLHYLHLPSLKKTEYTIPYMLEEKVSENINTLHFAFSPQLKKEQYYLTTTTSQAKLTTWLTELKTHQLFPYALHTDFIPDNDAYINKDSLLVNRMDITGALSETMVDLYLKSLNEKTNIHVFDDSHSDIIAKCQKHPLTNTIMHHENYASFFATQYHKQPQINLLQGAFKNQQRTEKGKKVWPICAISLLVSFFLYVGNLTWQYKGLSAQLHTIKQQTNHLYYTFFPDATSIVSPQFRIQQLLKNGGDSTNNNTFLTLLYRLSPFIKQTQKLQIRSMQYDNDTLKLELEANDFQTLANLQEKLTTAILHVEQLRAESHKEKVIATWRISL